MGEGVWLFPYQWQTSVYLAVSNMLPQPRLRACLCVQAQLLSLCERACARLRAVLGKVCLHVCVHVVTARVSVGLGLDRLMGKAQQAGNGIRMVCGSLQLGLPFVGDCLCPRAGYS